MPVLLPFRAFRFSVTAGDLANLIYVPGEEEPQVAADVDAIEEARPALFVYRQEFRVPGEDRECVRAGIMGVLNRDEAGVLPHEETCADRVAGCASAIESRRDVGSLWLWCGDTERLLTPCLEREDGATAEVRDRFGCLHRIWRVEQYGEIDRVQQALTSQTLYLADGHHRYAAGWNFATIQIRTPELRMRPGSGPLPDIDTLERNARAGLLLPPKTTDFWPKLVAGLVMHRP